ncbi:MAG: transglutaminase domain-containing protein [Pedobacter sp.]|uniref:transglutaminase domain-containing protein n=1 Tax=Pedobacter sp. TaxID=1411316 RepID=UPI002806F566|nr:transglutaminase domain-containing protein [Pedobacter sp.]MDQ8003347.1 transglutaminase domain-containing protein [Pedobacter sp.]
MKKTVYFLSISLLFCFTTNAQNSFKSAWESFLKNDTEAAKKEFEELSKRPEFANDAYLSLSLLAELEQKNDDAFNYFQKFYLNSKNAEPYLSALWRSPAVNSSYSKITPAALALMNEIVKNKAYDGSLNAMAYSVIGKHYKSVKKLADAEKAFAQIGSVDNWLVTSTFENISTSGFDKIHAPLNNPQMDAVFIGKKNINFGWRKVPHLKRDKWFDFTFYDDAYNAIVFAQSFVNAPTDIEGQLRIGVSGSVKVWVNDQLIITEAEERNNDLDAYISTVKLNKGNNRILVQIGESYANNSNFLIRITDANGYPIPGITNLDEYQPYQKEGSFKAVGITPKSYAYFKNLVASDTSNYLNQLLLAKLYLRDDFVFEPRIILEKLKQKFPESTFINTLMIALHSKEDNRTGVETLQEQIKTADPKSTQALKLAYSEFYNQENYDKAEEIASELEKRFGEDEDVIAKKIALSGKRNEQDKIIGLVEKAYKRWPQNRNFSYIKYILEKEIKKSSQAEGILTKYLNENEDYEYATILANTYFNKGNSKGGFDIYLEKLKLDPGSTGIYSDLSSKYYTLQKYDKAEEYINKAIALAPYIASYYKTLGTIHEARKENTKAEEAYKKSLSINPNNYEAIEQLRRLKKNKDVFSYFEQPNVAAQIKSAPKAADYPDDHSIILNEEVQTVVYENGGSEEKHFLTSKVFTAKGLETYKQYNISYNSDQTLIVEAAETIKSNGTKTPAEQNDNQLVFTNLEVGDVINIRYKLRNYNVGSLTSHFWTSFYFSHGSRYINHKYSLLISKNKKFNHKFSLEDIPAKKVDADEFDLYKWEATNTAGMIYEDKMPPLDDVANILYISTIPDWQFVSNWYNNLATAKARSSYEIRTLTDELFAGQKPTELQKVKKIFQYITQNISYSSVSFRQSGIVPQSPATVINSRIGDCKDVSTLFVAMCKQVGVDAELVLVKTRDNGQNTLLLPSIDFNHCIAKANIGGTEHYIELTSNVLPFSSFSNDDLGASILPINATSNQLIKLRPKNRVQNRMSYITKVAIKGADMHLTETNFCTGSMASYIRYSFKDLSPKDQLKKMKDEISGKYPDNEAISLSFENLDPKTSVSDTLRASSTYNILKVCKPVAGMNIFALPWTTAVAPSSLTVTEPRHFGIDLTQLFWSDSNDEQIELTLPEGKKLMETVKPLTIDNEFFSYRLNSQPKGNTIIIKREMTFKKDFVAKEKVSEFNALYKQVIEADNQQLAYK